MRIDSREYGSYFKEMLTTRMNTSLTCAAFGDHSFINSHNLIIGAALDYLYKREKSSIVVVLCANNGLVETKVEIPYYAVYKQDPIKVNQMIDDFIEDVFDKYNVREFNHVSEIN